MAHWTKPKPPNTMKFNFDNTYTKLPAKLYSLVNPVPVAMPRTLLFNTLLAEEIGLTMETKDTNEIAAYLSGNKLLADAKPIAQAYAGHQFGHFTMLGDGRAILLGEHITPTNKRLDIQLKGAGQTPYSRRGDGRATLRAMLREYIISEAMYGLKIPTSRSLAVIGSGEKVYREEINEGAILTRIAASHIRVGTFEYVSQFLTNEELQIFTDYVIDRHYPALKEKENKALELLRAVMDKQTDLIVNWMRVGFIHGVMNTDNMSIAGETFDYGPCAFMNAYDPKTVFSAIDTNGRYAYANQPKIALWNLSCFAETLLPLLHTDMPEAIKMAEELLNTFATNYQQKWTAMMGNKLGFNTVAANENEQQLISELFNWMEDNKADYTNTFLTIQSDMLNPKGIYNQSPFLNWYAKWKKLLEEKGISLENAQQIMLENNPYFIPRNHLVEQALDNACYKHDFTLFNQLVEATSTAYTNNIEWAALQNPPESGDQYYQTHCGT